MTPDQINGIFEFTGALFVVQSVRAVLKDRQVKGIRWPIVAFMSFWGVWNLYFYPAVNCWFSFAGGAFLVLANVVWLILLAYFRNGRR